MEFGRIKENSEGMIIGMESKNLIDIEDLSVAEIMEIVDLANKIMANPSDYSDACRGKILATLFYEPSTRTRMSFSAAMMRLGGNVIGFDNPQNSSVSKGESLKDTLTVVGGYADIIAIRHPYEGAAAAAAMFSAAPVINAGDGGHLHPTQTLTDVVTLYNEKGRLDNLCIGLCGDLKYGRTVHSLIKAMSRFKGNKFVLISTPELSVPQYIKDDMTAAGCEFTEVSGLREAMGELDVLYMTRIQRERFSSDREYERQKGVFVLDSEKLMFAKKDLRILHPLPRVDEISYEVDDDERAKYFAQTVYGMYARMALFMTMLNGDKNNYVPYVQTTTQDICCTNEHCITRNETYLPKRYKEYGDTLVCEYCENRIHI